MAQNQMIPQAPVMPQAPMQQNFNVRRINLNQKQGFQENPHMNFSAAQQYPLFEALGDLSPYSLK